MTSMQQPGGMADLERRLREAYVALATIHGNAAAIQVRATHPLCLPENQHDTTRVCAMA